MHEFRYTLFKHKLNDTSTFPRFSMIETLDWHPSPILFINLEIKNFVPCFVKDSPCLTIILVVIPARDAAPVIVFQLPPSQIPGSRGIYL